MTSEELIIGLRNIANMMKRNRLPYHQRVAEETIKNLEQRGSEWEIAYERGKVEVLDKIREEVNDLTYYCFEVSPRNVIEDVLKIINKYSEVKDDR